MIAVFKDDEIPPFAVFLANPPIDMTRNPIASRLIIDSMHRAHRAWKSDVTMLQLLERELVIDQHVAMRTVYLRGWFECFERCGEAGYHRYAHITV